MSCFHRFPKFHRRQKSSFTPEKDENKDTILNTSSSTVVSKIVYTLDTCLCGWCCKAL